MFIIIVQIEEHVNYNVEKDKIEGHEDFGDNKANIVPCCCHDQEFVNQMERTNRMLFVKW
jgi:hypothetical protein